MRDWDKDERYNIDMLKVLRGLDADHIWAIRYFTYMSSILFHNAFEITKVMTTDEFMLKTSEFIARGMKNVSQAVCKGVNVKELLTDTCKVCNTKLDRYDMVLHCADHIQQKCQNDNLEFINDDVIEQIREVMLLEQEFLEHVAEP
ncbi:MAG: hypothetical protein OXC46_02580 [Thaumarchaeota archaeon]|nr:hypothetical protein [Nitrososphaerota archaeon]